VKRSLRKSIRGSVSVVVAGFAALAVAEPVPGVFQVQAPAGQIATVQGVANHGLMATGGLFVRATSESRTTYRWAPPSNLTIYNGPTHPNYSAALAMTADGSFIAGLQFDGRDGNGAAVNLQAFRAGPGGEFQALGRLRPSDQDSQALSISNDGGVVVGKSGDLNETSVRAFIWTPSTGMEEIPGLRPNAVISQANDVSGNGEYVVGYSKIGNVFAPEEAWIWTRETGHTPLPTLSALPQMASAIPRGVSADGRYVAGISLADDFSSRAVRWVDGVIETLGSVPGYNIQSYAYGISDDGGTIFGVATGAASDTGFIWTEAMQMMQANEFFAMHGLSLPGTIETITSMSSDGTAFGVRIQNIRGDFVVTIPAPGSVVVIGVLAVVRRRR